jgi:hypothetical protein
MERAEPRMDANKHELFSDRINGIDRMNKLILALLVLSGIGFIASLFVHVATYLELNLAVSTPSIRFLHIGLFAVFGLVYLYNKKYSAIENEYWKKALENAPKGLISLFSVILIWAIVHVSIGVYGFVRNGKISEVNGQKVLSKRGQIVRNLTEGEYALRKDKTLRIISSIWMVAYMVPFNCAIGSTLLNKREGEVLIEDE